ncbi:MAG: TolC family protein [Nitrospirae bacterium]|nr:TolC family protein [Nitrospirota bacterium]
MLTVILPTSLLGTETFDYRLMEVDSYPTTQETSYKSYGLQELYRHAMKTSEVIKISEEDIFIAQQQKMKTIAAIMPKLSAFYTYTRYNRDKTVSGGMVMQPESSIIGGIRLDESLSLGGVELKTIDIAEKTIEKNTYNYRAITEEYLYAVASAFYDYLKAKKAEEIAQANVERLKLYLEAAEIKLKIGEVTKTFLLRANTELSTAMSEVLRAQNEREIKKAALKNVAGIAGDFDVIETPPPTHDFSGCLVDGIECFTQVALKERNEIKSHSTKRDIAQKVIESAKGSFWPTISIEGVLLKKDDTPGWLFNNTDTAYASIKLSYPFYDGGARKAELREAMAKQRQSELAIESLKKSISLDVRSSCLNYITQRGIIQSLTDALTYATDNYSSVKRQFDAGIATSLDVMDANNLLATSQRRLSDAVYSYEMAHLRLKRSMGIFLSAIEHHF